MPVLGSVLAMGYRKLCHNGPRFSDRQDWADTAKQCRQEQSDLGLHCLPFRLNLLNTLLFGKTTL